MNENRIIPRKIGLIAGKGDLPMIVAETLSKQGVSVYTIGFRGLTSPRLRLYSAEMRWVTLGQIGLIIEHLKSWEAKHAALAGLIKHKNIFAGILFDALAKRLFLQMKDQRADSILGAFAGQLKQEGIELLPTGDIIPDCIITEGLLAGEALTHGELEDVRFGFRIAKGVALHDVGQTIVVKNRAVIAVEAMEGTDRCILRAGRIAGKGCVVIKVAKPKQDKRFDVPVIGERTVAMMRKAGSAVLAVEAGSTLLLRKERVTLSATRKKIKIYGIPPFLTEGPNE